MERNQTFGYKKHGGIYTKFFFRQDALHLMFAAWVALNLAPEGRISVQECWLF